VAAYKTGLQARFLVDRMAESEKSIHKALTKLMSQLESIEKKVNNNSVDLGTVREKVNLVMTSISLVKEEEAQVARQLKSVPPPYGVPGGARIIGANSDRYANSATPTASSGQGVLCQSGELQPTSLS
jgi:CII-binding regulator of phage lambda lysogenization HflD